MPTVVLVRKGGIEVSKPIICLQIIENLREISAYPSDKRFAELFHFSILRKQMTDVSQARKGATSPQVN